MANDGDSLATPTQSIAGQSVETDRPDIRPVPEQADSLAWRFPTPEEIRAELSSEFTEEQKEKVWAEAAEAVKVYHDDIVRRWKEEMDTLLVYAGLFSAVLTAFNVQSYQLLQPEPMDTTVALLQEISSQLSSFTVAAPFVNSTRNGVSGNTQPPFQAPTSAVWLNTLWFSSLVFSLASASIALFVKQWLHETTVRGTSRESARLRQYRLNGLLKWRVGMVVTALPILLQIAAIMFFIGLVILLWTLHPTVAAITSSLVAILFTSLLAVTILPVLKSDCSYRSPASFAIYTLLRHTRNTLLQAIRNFCKVIYMSCTQGAAWLDVARTQFDRLGEFAYERCDNMPTWHGRDQNEIHSHLGALHRGIITTAYSTTADKRFISSMPVIFSDLPPDDVVLCFEGLLDFMKAEWGHWHMPEPVHHQDIFTLPLCALYGLRHMLAISEKGGAWTNDVRIIVGHFSDREHPETSQEFAELACKTFCQLALEDRGNRTLFGVAYRTLEIMYDQQGARHHTYETLSCAKAVYEVEMAAWDPSLGFRSFRDTTQAVFILLHYIRATISSHSQLSPCQANAMLTWGRQELSRLHQWLRDLEWRGLHEGCLAISGEAAAVLVFPHVVSRYLIRNLIDPLIALCLMPGGRALVSTELVSAVEHTWASARLAYPDSLDPEARVVWCTGLDCIDARLEELRRVVTEY